MLNLIESAKKGMKNLGKKIMTQAYYVHASTLLNSLITKRENFTDPEYDLSIIKTAADADSYVKMSLSKYSYLMYKAGYNLKSSNNDALKYLSARFKIMSIATGKPFDILMQEIADDLIKFSNAFLVKSRVDMIMPGIHATGILSDKPVGGYFRVDPTEIRIQRDKNGSIVKYRQITGTGETKDFAKEDVIHFYLDKDAGNAFGTPRISAALEDVKLLRKVEGIVVALIYRFSMPLYHIKVGIAGKPGMQGTKTEIKDIENKVKQMSLDGMLVTNEKIAIEAIGAQGAALDASSYLAYFEKRVFTALGVSESQMGRGGAKQDADSMEAQVHDTVKYIQRVLSIFVDNDIILELLLEGGFNPIIKDEDMVHYVFNEISLDTKVKLENHEVLKYQSNLQTIEETRRNIGMEPEVDEARLYANMIEQKNILEQIKVQSDNANAINSAKATNGNGQQTKPKQNKAVSSINTPTNQHGTTSVKLKESYKNIDIIESKRKIHKKYSNYYSDVYSLYNQLKNNIVNDISKKDEFIKTAQSSVNQRIKYDILNEFSGGASMAIEDANKISNTSYYSIINGNVYCAEVMRNTERTINDLFNDLNNRLKASGGTPDGISIAFNSLEYRLRFTLEFALPKSFWLGYAKQANSLGYKHVYIDFHGSKDEQQNSNIIDTNSFNLNDIPAFHPFCDCTMYIKAGD